MSSFGRFQCRTPVRSPRLSTHRRDPILRVRSILALLLAGMLLAAGVASAQDTNTDTLGDYTTTTPTVTTPTTSTPEESPASSVGGETESNGNAPSVASQPAGSAPSSLAFTGADPLLLIVLGLGLAGGATALLVRERRSSSQGR
jgi:hypothetical protein